MSSLLKNFFKTIKANIMAKKLDMELEDNSTVTINGRTFSGRNVSIVDGNVIIDGSTVIDDLPHTINITVDGDAKHINNMNGHVTTNNVYGDI